MTTVVEHVQQLTGKLNARKSKLKKNQAYYESEHRPSAVGVATPPEMKRLLAAVGWPRIAVDSLEERLDPEGFRLAGEGVASEKLWSWWQRNNLDLESSLGHLEALIHGIAYVTISAPDPEDPFADQTMPLIRVESAFNMYAEINPVTGWVNRAVRLYQTDEGEAATLLLPNVTYQLSKTGKAGEWRITSEVEHNLGRVLVVPLLNRESLGSREGKSEITRELRTVTDAGARTMMNLQAAMELLAVPQRLLWGVTQEDFAQSDGNPGAMLEAYFARIMAFENPEGKAEQFAAADLRNFIETLQELAKQAAAYAVIPVQYVSFSSDNPASAEAIQASEVRLVKRAERKAKLFGAAWEEVMRLAMWVIEGDIPAPAFRMEMLWRNPATPTYAAKADGVTKLYANGQGVIPLERARIDMGYTPEERAEMKKWDKENPTVQLSSLLAPRTPPSQSDELT